MNALVKPCATPPGENALLEAVEDASGKRLWRIRLDRFQGTMGVSFTGGRDSKIIPLSEAYLSEHSVDEYLMEISRIMGPLIEVVGYDVAWNLVFSERNGHKERDRMAAAKAVSALAPAYAKIHEVLRELKYNWYHDAYDFRDVWVVKGKIIRPDRDALQNVVCALHIENGISMGNGDGYHRGFDEKPFSSVKRLSVEILKKAIAKEMEREKRERQS